MRITHHVAAVAVAGLMLVTSGIAAADGDLARGEQLFDLCAQCHGSEAQGNRMFLAPAIAGLDQWYIEMQLGKFRAGLRGLHFDDISGMRMRPMSLMLASDEDVQAVAAYVASLPVTKPARTVDGNAETGKALYVLCGACHGPNAEGMQAISAPPMKSLDDWYLVEQLNKFKTGVRGTAPGDTTGVLMGPSSPMALTLTTEQSVRDVVAHIMTLSQ